MLLVDRYETSRYIANVKVPLLILHGERDGVVPVAMGRELARLANEPKRLVVFPEGRHSNLYVDGNNALDAVRRWIAELKRADGLDAKSPPPGGAETECIENLAEPASLPRPAETAAARRTAGAAAKPAWTGRSTGTSTGAAAAGCAGTRRRRLAGQQPFALRLLARQLARAPHGLGLLAHALLGGLLEIVPELHLAEDALALHFLLQRLESLIDVVVADLNQQVVVSLG